MFKLKDVALPSVEKLAQDGFLPAHSFPGCYPLYYLLIDEMNRTEVICPDCANKAERREEMQAYSEMLVGSRVNFELPDLYCDCCEERIKSAYAEEEVEND